MNSLSPEDKEIIAMLQKKYSEMISSYERRISTRGNGPVKNTEIKRLEEARRILTLLETNPEEVRNLINAKKERIKKEAFVPEYPMYPASFSDNFNHEYEIMKNLLKSINTYTEYIGKTVSEPIREEDFERVVDSWLAETGFPRSNLSNSHRFTSYHQKKEYLSEIMNYYKIKKDYGRILEMLMGQMSGDYALYINVGSGANEKQWIPRDESFKQNVLGRYTKHLFLIFDEEGEADIEWPNLFITIPNPKLAKIVEFLGVEPSVERLSENCIQYIFTPTIGSSTREIRILFLNTWITNIGYFALEPLIQNAQLKIVTCTKWDKCIDELFESPYILNHFTYYIQNFYAHSPYFVPAPNYASDRLHYLIDLESLRSTGLSYSNLVDKQSTGMSYAKFKNNARNRGVSYKQKGNATFWNNLRGGKRSGKKKTRKLKK